MIERTAKTGKNLQIPTQKMPAVFFARDTDNRQLYTSFK
jgi:hypothetical protein